MKLKKNIKGFSIIELLIGLLIVSILALVANPYYEKYIQNSKINSSLTGLNFYRTSIAVCLQSKIDYKVCNGGSYSIPKDFYNEDIQGIKSIETKQSIINVVSSVFLPDLDDFVKIKYRPVKKNSVIEWEISCNDYDIGTVVDNCSKQYKTK